MKTKEVIVPRALILEHVPHPEPYGESCVVLINDMYTDVYTNDEGELYTITNDVQLIQYLKNHEHTDSSLRISDDDTVLRSANIDDVLLLKSWMNSNKNWLMRKQTYDDEAVRLFISHMITSKSHLFIIEATEVPVGTVSYEQRKEEMIVDLRDYVQNAANQHSLLKAFELVENLIQQNFEIKKLLTTVLEEDHFHTALLEKTGFFRVCDEDVEMTIDINQSRTLFFAKIIKE